MRLKAQTLVKLCALVGAIVCAAPLHVIASDVNEIPVNGLPPPLELRQLDQSAKELIKRWNIPGASIAVCKDGKLVYARGFGFADLDDKTPVVPDQSLFRIASLSKPITAAAVLKLVDDGKLKLDDTVLDVMQPILP